MHPRSDKNAGDKKLGRFEILSIKINLPTSVLNVTKPIEQGSPTGVPPTIKDIRLKIYYISLIVVPPQYHGPHPDTFRRGP